LRLALAVTFVGVLATSALAVEGTLVGSGGQTKIGV
jgi:hypothetical protein